MEIPNLFYKKLEVWEEVGVSGRGVDGANRIFQKARWDEPGRHHRGATELANDYIFSESRSLLRG